MGSDFEAASEGSDVKLRGSRKGREGKMRGGRGVRQAGYAPRAMPAEMQIAAGQRKQVMEISWKQSVAGSWECVEGTQRQGMGVLGKGKLKI